MTAPSLYEAVMAFNATDLATILNDAGVVSDQPKNKEAKTQLWLRMIGDPKRIHAAYERLGGRARRALEVLQQAGGELTASRFQARLEKAGIVERTPASANALSGWAANTVSPVSVRNPTTFEQVLANLLLRGVIWTYGLPASGPANGKLSFSGGRYVYIPEEIAAHLPPPPPLAESAPEIKQVVAGSARICQRDLYLMWSASREAAFQTTANGLLRMSDLKRVAGQLLQPEILATGTRETDYRRVFFLRRLLAAKGLLHEQPGAIAAVSNPLFLSQPPAERVRESFLSWQDGAWWNELWATYNNGTTRASGNPLDFAAQQVVQARRTVLEALSRLVGRAGKRQSEAGAWVTLDELDEHLHDHDEEFLIQRIGPADLRNYYYAPANYSAYQYNMLGWVWDAGPDEETRWRSVERVFIQAVLTEGLYWLGLVDLGYGQEVTVEGGKAPAGLTAVRLTDMGRWLLLGGRPPAIPEETGRVVLQPNFHIFAFDPISDGVLARLDGFATRLNAERAIEFEITQGSVYRGQLAGQSVPEIKAWLEEVTGSPLPQNVSRSMDEWHTAFERVIVRPRLAWLEVARPSLAEAVLQDPALKKLIVRRVTPTGFFVRADQADALERALLAHDELPGRAADPSSALADAIQLDEAGRVTFRVPAPGLHVLARLHALAEQTPDGWRITPASITHAAAHGKDAPALLADLAAMARGVPAALQANIKTWARHYGRVTVQSVALLQFRDQETLDDLRREPELKGLLKSLKPEAKLGIAMVDPARLEQVLALLTAHSVEVVRL
jgi:hypothetical protein